MFALCWLIELTGTGSVWRLMNSGLHDGCFEVVIKSLFFDKRRMSVIRHAYRLKATCSNDLCKMFAKRSISV